MPTLMTPDELLPVHRPDVSLLRLMPAALYHVIGAFWRYAEDELAAGRRPVRLSVFRRDFYTRNAHPPVEAAHLYEIQAACGGDMGRLATGVTVWDAAMSAMLSPTLAAPLPDFLASLGDRWLLDVAA